MRSARRARGNGALVRGRPRALLGVLAAASLVVAAAPAAPAQAAGPAGPLVLTEGSGAARRADAGETAGPTKLRIVPGAGSLGVHWTVTGRSQIRGFRVRWRPVSILPQPWSSPVERSGASRGYTITDLPAEPYEVRVRGILEGETLGAVVSETATPLAGEGEEPEEEPPVEEEEPPVEEEEPPVEEEAPGGTTLPRAPAGLPTPAGGWKVVLADAFAAPIGTGAGEDQLWRLPEEFERSFNSDELEVWSPSQVNTVQSGLDLSCKHETNVGGTGKDYLCGFVFTKGTFGMRSYAGSTFAVECVCKWPVNTNEADPGFWQDGYELGTEQEIDDFEGYGWKPDGTYEYGAGIPVAVGLGEYTVYHTNGGVVKAFGFDPTAGFHRYTTLIKPAGPLDTEFAEYIDGVFKWRFLALTPPVSIWQHLILSYALREDGKNFTSGTRHFDIRSVEVYQDAPHAGEDVTGGGIAPGTKLAP